VPSWADSVTGHLLERSLFHGAHFWQELIGID